MTRALNGTQIVHYGMDAGSVPKGSFSWVGSSTPETNSNDLSALACRITDDLRLGRNVTLGLMGGQRLAELMIEHDVGVATAHSYVVKKLDFDYFDGEER